MKCRLHPLLLGCLAILLQAAAIAAEPDPGEHARLYTAPDPEAGGGLQGQIASPDRPVLQVLAIPAGRPEHVYRAEIPDSERRTFRFTGLPIDRYDLVVFYGDAVYEGFRLHRGSDTLEDGDREQIADIVARSEPFYTIKTIHRLEGEPGRGGEARAFCTFARDRESERYMGPLARTGLRRTHKLVLLRQVGPGWQIARTRDLYPVWVEGEHVLEPRHGHRPALSGIRVTDHIRDLGRIEL